MTIENDENDNSVQRVIVGWILGAFVLGGGFGLRSVMNVESSARSRSPSSAPILEWSDLPEDEIDLEPFYFSSSAPIDHRANVLIDIGSKPNRTKLNGYGGYIAFRTLPGSKNIDRFLYCQNFDDTTLRVNTALSRIDLTAEHRFPCFGFSIKELLAGMSLIHFVGIEALRLQLEPGFDPNIGGVLNISLLSKPIVHRSLKLSIIKIPNGAYRVLSPKKVPFNQIDLEFRKSGLLTMGFPSGLVAMELFNQTPSAGTHTPLGRLVVDIDLPRSK